MSLKKNKKCLLKKSYISYEEIKLNNPTRCFIFTFGHSFINNMFLNILGQDVAEIALSYVIHYIVMCEKQYINWPTTISISNDIWEMKFNSGANMHTQPASLVTRNGVYHNDYSAIFSTSQFSGDKSCTDDYKYIANNN